MHATPRLVLVVAVMLLANVACRAAEPLVLTLRAEATVSGSQVSVGDVAALEGGDAQQRERIAKLDLAELPLSSQPILVSQQQIDFRLRVAGIDDRAFRLEGPRFVRVSRPATEALDNKIAAVARQAVEQKLPAGTEDAAIQLAQPVRLPPLSAEGEDIHLEAELRGPVTVPGRVMVEVGIYIRGARRLGLPVYLEVKKLQSAPVAIRRIEVGEAFRSDNVRIERVAVENPPKAAVDVAGLMGRHARRTVAAGRLIEPGDVESDTQLAIVIHQRDLIHILAKVGPLQVKARGEALQEGRIGQLIQVRNVDSNATVAGRVVDRSTVEVDY
ncbi:MAG TPA: flagellar basal body P-ring formation chaperone FlgA [Gemmataceae bacterium]|nr:flagellar basal body P-ring formation chaperone FlgA [Gemmataceae bacterium]